MPTKTDRIAPGIYRAHWMEHVSVEHVFLAKDGIDKMAAEDGVSRFVVIIDGSTVKTVPFEVRMLTKAVNPNTIGILVLNAPLAGELMGRMFNSIMPMKVEFFRDEDIVRRRAQELLEAESSPHAS